MSPLTTPLRFYGEVRFYGEITLNGVQSLMDRVREIGHPELDLAERVVRFYVELDLDSASPLSDDMQMVLDVAAGAIPPFDRDALASVLWATEQIEALRDEIASEFGLRVTLTREPPCAFHLTAPLTKAEDEAL